MGSKDNITAADSKFLNSIDFFAANENYYSKLIDFETFFPITFKLRKL